MGFNELAGSEEQFVVNRDFHLGNILLDRGQWKLIDPKPLAGERAFDTAHFLRSLLPARPWICSRANFSSPRNAFGNGLCSALSKTPNGPQRPAWTIPSATARLPRPWTIDRRPLVDV